MCQNVTGCNGWKSRKSLQINMCNGVTGFFAVFSGIESGSFSMAREHPRFNPKGIASSSPGLARRREGRPWVMAFEFHNPEKVEYQKLTRNRFNPCRVVIPLYSHPGWLVPRDPGLKASIPLGLKNQRRRPKNHSVFHPKQRRTCNGCTALHPASRSSPKPCPRPGW